MKIRVLRAAIAAVVLFSGLVFSPAWGREAAVTRQEAEDFDFAGGLLARGMYGMAASSYADYLKKYPDGAYVEEARYRMAESYFMNGEYGKALEGFQEIIKKATDPEIIGDARVRAGQILYTEGNNEKSSLFFRKALSTQGIRKEAAETAEYYLSEIGKSEGLTEEAIEAFSAFLDKYGTGRYAGFAALNLGDLYADSGDLVRAAQSYRKAADSASDDGFAAEARLRAGEVLSMEGRTSDAIEKYEKVMTAIQETGPRDRAAMGIVVAYYKAGESARVTAEAPALISGIVDSEIKSRVEYLLANSYLDTDRFSEALALYNDIIEKGGVPRLVRRARINKCWALYNLSRYDLCAETAQAYLDDGFEEDADEAAYIKARALASSGEWDRALENYRDFLKDHPGSDLRREALYDKGWAHYRRGERGAGADALGKFINEFPEDERSPGALLKIAQEYLEGAEYQRAADLYEKFLRDYHEDPQKQFAVYQMARSFYEAGEFDRAIELYDELLEDLASPELAEAALYWKALSYQRKGDWENAIANFQQVAGKDGEYAVRASEAVAFNLFQKGEVVEAAEAYYYIITGSEDPRAGISGDIYLWTAEFYTQMAESGRALEIISVFRERYPGVSEDVAAYLTGVNYNTQGRSRDAVGYFTEALDKGISSPARERCYLGLGVAWSAIGEDQKAMEALGNALSGAGDNITGAMARMEMGDIHSRQNDPASAARNYAMVAILYEDPEITPEALFRAATHFQRAGQGGEAERLFRELLAKYPESERAGQLKERFLEGHAESAE